MPHLQNQSRKKSSKRKKFKREASISCTFAFIEVFHIIVSLVEAKKSTTFLFITNLKKFCS